VQDYVFGQIGNEINREAEVLASLPAGMVAVHTALIFDNQVQNGGFNQFFWNCSHRRVIQALDGLDFLGAASHTALLEEAMKLAGAQRDQLLPYHLEGTVAAFSGSYQEEVFAELDDRYYALPELHNFIAQVIRQHPERFCPSWWRWLADESRQ
jgi:hypothetical protein